MCIEERLKEKWVNDPTAAVVYKYSNVEDASIKYDGKRPYQWFPCGAERYKESGGVKHYQDTTDSAATSTLRNHVEKCFGKKAVQDSYSGKVSDDKDDSIFRLFARQGQQPVTAAHRNYTGPESR